MTPIRSVLLLVLFLFLHTSAYCSPQTIIIKVSSRDCILCNINLDNVYRYSGTTPKILVLKKDEEEEVEFLATLNLDKRMNTIVYFSDSLYYNYDSTERSVFYVTEGAAIKFKKYLKEVTMEDLALLFGKHVPGKGAGIIMPKSAYFSDLGSYIGIIDRKGQCYRIKKDDLSEVYDTISLITPSIVKDIFKSRYGNEYIERMKRYEAVLKLPDVRMLPNAVSKTFYKDDTLYAIVNTYDAETKIENSAADTITTIIPLMNIVKFKDNKYLGTLWLEEDKEMNSGHYYVIPTMFFVERGNTYMSVLKRALSDDNPVFTEMKANGQKLEMVAMAPIQVPEVHVSSNMGYSALGISTSKKYVAFNTTSYIYDMATFRKYDLPFYMERNKMNRKEMEELRAGTPSYIISIHDDDNNLNILYRSNDSVKHASCTIEKDKLKLRRETLLSTNSPAGGPFSYLIADKNGYYRYIKEKQAIEYFSY